MWLSLRKTRFKVFDMTLSDECFNYLSPKGEIICRKDEDFDAIHLQICTDGWYT